MDVQTNSLKIIKGPFLKTLRETGLGEKKTCVCPKLKFCTDSTDLLNRDKKVGETNLAPSTLIFLVEAEAHPAVVGHLLAPVDQHVDVVRVVKRLRLAPDDGKGGGDVGRPRGVRELHLVAVDGVAQQLGVHAGHPALDVELADEPGLDDELGDVVDLHPDALLKAGADQDLRSPSGRGVNAGTEGGAGPDAGSDPVDAGDENVVPAVLRGVVSAAVPWNSQQSVQSHLRSVQSSVGQERREKNLDKWLEVTQMQGGGKFSVIQLDNLECHQDIPHSQSKLIPVSPTIFLL